jgi:hypothetical protein
LIGDDHCPAELCGRAAVVLGPEPDDGLRADGMGGVVVFEEIGGGDDFVARVGGRVGGNGNGRGGAVGLVVGDEGEGNPVSVVGVVGFGPERAVALNDAPVEAVGAESQAEAAAGGAVG